MKQLSLQIRSRLTLRVRLTLWVMGLLLVASVGLLAFVNMAVPMARPLEGRIAPGETRRVTLTLVTEDPEWIFPREDVTRGLPGQVPFRITLFPRQEFPLSPAQPPPAYAYAVPISDVREDIFHQLRTISFIGLGVIVALGGIGSYWLAGRALRPLHKLAEAAQEIDAKTLDTRLELERPEDELNRLACSFNAMLNRLEAAFEQQGRFVADAAHELRTPLATLRATLDVVSSAPDATIELYRAMTATLERALTRLQRLVDDLLLLATEEPNVQKAALAIQPVLEDELLHLKPLADEHSVTLRLRAGSDLLVRGDSTVLARVFHNLIENGIRYNREGGEVVVNVYAEGESVVLTVADTGIGIPAEQQSRIFDRFYRVDLSRSRHKGGAGLGLSIARHIVELHGGELSVESTPDVGSTFAVKLPLYSSPDIMD